ncbi:MAG: RNA-guided endonuclease InsQ/TnpB family protein [Xenococcaceae cyanobacterium]
MNILITIPSPIPHGHAVGIDVGIASMLSTSDGLVIPRPRFLDKALRKIELLQRKLKKKRLGSSKWNKLQKRIALLHEAVANKRKEYHFRLAYQLCEGVGMIFVENINFKSWSRGLFCQQSLDMGLGQFLEVLQYVCSKTDTFFAKVDKDFTSQICPNCGTRTGKKELGVRTHLCPECGYKQDRDLAAAEVVRARGLNSLQALVSPVRDRGLENIAVGAPVIKQPSNGGLAGAKA